MIKWAVVIVCFISTGSLAQDSDSTNWDLEGLNTGRSASYLSSLEKEVLLELNKVRSNPSRYASLYLVPMLGSFNGKLDTRNKIETREGVSAVKECIAQLQKTPKLNLLGPDKDLTKAALHHTSLQSKTRETGHTSPNGETFEHRLRNVKFNSSAECISYGSGDARSIVVSLLIDDGVPARGHRKIILDARYAAVGIAVGSHVVYSKMCTLDFGGSPTTGRK